MPPAPGASGRAPPRAVPEPGAALVARVKDLTCERIGAERGDVLLCRDERGLLDAITPALPATIIGIAGFWIVHHLSSRRQTRDETFKMCQEARALVDAIAGEAIKAWSRAGNDEEA